VLKQRTVLIKRESKDESMEKALEKYKEKLSQVEMDLETKSAALVAAKKKLMAEKGAIVVAGKEEGLKERAAKDKLRKLISKLRKRAEVYSV